MLWMLGVIWQRLRLMWAVPASELIVLAWDGGSSRRKLRSRSHRLTGTSAPGIFFLFLSPRQPSCSRLFVSYFWPREAVRLKSTDSWRARAVASRDQIVLSRLVVLNEIDKEFPESGELLRDDMTQELPRQ